MTKDCKLKDSGFNMAIPKAPIEELKIGRVRAYLHGHTDCPKCDALMIFSKVDRNYINCLNPGCELYGVMFQRPSVELIPIWGNCEISVNQIGHVGP